MEIQKNLTYLEMAHKGIYWLVLFVLAAMLFACLIRAVRGPRIADRCSQYDGYYGHGYDCGHGTFAKRELFGRYLPDLCDGKLPRCNCTCQGVYGYL